MCNHNIGKYSTDFDLNADSAVCYAMKSFNLNEEINIFYGKRSNGEFFIHNGFVCVDNEDDFVPLKLGISKSDPLFAEKSSLCTKLGLPPCGVFKLFEKSGKTHDNKLLAFLRVFHMTKEQLDIFSGDTDTMSDLMDAEKPFDDLDGKVNTFLAVRSSLLIRGYDGYDGHDQKHENHNETIYLLLKCERKILESHMEKVAT